MAETAILYSESGTQPIAQAEAMLNNWQALTKVKVGAYFPCLTIISGWGYTHDRRVDGQRHVNHPPIDHPYKCHGNTNHSRVPQLSKAPIPTSKWKYGPNLLQT